MEYRGIKLHESVKLYKKNGEYNKQIKKALDKLVEVLAENNHILKSGYKGNSEKISIDFKCGHEPHELVPYAYYTGVRCPKCSPSPEQAKADFYKLIEKNNHTALTDYVKGLGKVLIDFKCGHESHWITPNDYKNNERGCPKCGTKKRVKSRLLNTEKALRKFIDKRDHILVSDFKGMRDNIQIDFKCGHEPQWINASSYYHRNGNCTKCSGHCSEQAKEEFFLKIESNGHEVLSEYKTTLEKVLIDFKCGHEPHWTIPYTYRKGHGCPTCGSESTAEKCSEQSRKEFPLLVESRGHILLSPYGKNSVEKVLIDFKCGHEPKWIRPDDYKYNGSGCIECAFKKHAERSRNLSQKCAKEFGLLVESNGHVLLTPYGKDQYEKVLIDLKCGHEPHFLAPSEYKQGTRCPECARIKSNEAKRKKGERLLKKAIKKNNHILLSDYIDVKTKVLIDFNCKHEPHWITPDSYRHAQQGCPKCSPQSYGEDIIRKWLDENMIMHEKGRISSSKKWLYDIIIPSENLIVEVHGMQHYKEVPYFHKARTFEQEQKNDRKKRKFAESLGYKYIEVDYRESKPELALERFLHQFNPIRENKEALKIEQLSLF